MAVISFRFQGVRAVDFSGIGIKRLLTNIFGQAAFIGALDLGPHAIRLRTRYYGWKVHLTSWFVLCIASVQIVLFTAIRCGRRLPDLLFGRRRAIDSVSITRQSRC